VGVAFDNQSIEKTEDAKPCDRVWQHDFGYKPNEYGGLEWNRTTDTRIFNTRGAQIINVYGAYSRVSCHVLQTVLHKNHTFLQYFRIT